MGNFDIVGRVLDDVELIVKSMLVGKLDSWFVRVLWSSYKMGIFLLNEDDGDVECG